MTTLPIINYQFFFSYQRPTAYRYGSGPGRSGGMLSSRPKKCRYAIPAHTVSLRALISGQQVSQSAGGRKLTSADTAHRLHSPPVHVTDQARVYIADTWLRRPGRACRVCGAPPTSPLSRPRATQLSVIINYVIAAYMRKCLPATSAAAT